MFHKIIQLKFLINVKTDSNNFLMQDLFQCKLTRKGTLAPSDRQSRLRKSMSLNTTLDTDIVSSTKVTYTSTEEGKLNFLNVIFV